MSRTRALVVLGVALLVVAGLAATSVARRPAQIAPNALEAARRATPASATPIPDVGEYYARLRDLGLSADETKPLVLAFLERTRPAPSPREPLPYWVDAESLAVDRALARLAAADAVRHELRRIYGDGVEEDSQFVQLFRPLDERLEFLSSAQQIRIERARIEYRRANPTARRAPVSASGRGAILGRSATPPVPPEYQTEWRGVLGSLLDSELVFEYELRESALAEQLRRADLGLTEPEFRETYALLDTLERKADATALGTARRRLRALLGGERFDRLWAARDPMFALIAEMLRARSIPEPTILAVYGVINATQDALADAVAMSGRDPTRAMEEARQAAAREERQIAEIIGDELAKTILTSRAQAVFEMSQLRSLPQREGRGDTHDEWNSSQRLVR